MAMPRKTIDDVIADLEKILSVFILHEEQDFKIGDITRQSLATIIAGLRAKNAELEDAKALAARLVNEISVGLTDAGQIQTRGLSGIRAAFGPDSSEYEQAGGIRTSERKKAGPKKKT